MRYITSYIVFFFYFFFFHHLDPACQPQRAFMTEQLRLLVVAKVYDPRWTIIVRVNLQIRSLIFIQLDHAISEPDRRRPCVHTAGSFIYINTKRNNKINYILNFLHNMGGHYEPTVRTYGVPSRSSTVPRLHRRRNSALYTPA